MRTRLTQDKDLDQLDLKMVRTRGETASAVFLGNEKAFCELFHEGNIKQGNVKNKMKRVTTTASLPPEQTRQLPPATAVATLPPPESQKRHHRYT